LEIAVVRNMIGIPIFEKYTNEIGFPFLELNPATTKFAVLPMIEPFPPKPIII
jgi:hypothetical protein